MLFSFLFLPRSTVDWNFFFSFPSVGLIPKYGIKAQPSLLDTLITSVFAITSYTFAKGVCITGYRQSQCAPVRRCGYVRREQ